MDTVYRVFSAAARLVQNRLVAASALAVVSAAIIALVSVHLTAITIIDGDKTRVVLTLDKNPQRVVASAGIALSEGDEVVAKDGFRVLSVNRAADVQITADGISTIVRMSNGLLPTSLKPWGLSLMRMTESTLT